MLQHRVLSSALRCHNLRLLLPRSVQHSPASCSLARGMTAMAAAVESAAAKRTVRGVVFDMDGTLTVPVIDFQYMRQVCNIQPPR